MYSVVTESFNPYSVEFSPFFDSRLAVAASQYFGIVGNAALFIYDMSSNALIQKFETQEALFDCAWSELHDAQIVTASGDGTLLLWDTNLNKLPIKMWQEHKREVFSVNWNLRTKETFVSCSWDGTIKIWRPEFSKSESTLQEHTGCVYVAQFSPHEGSVIASGCADGSFKIWDTRVKHHSMQTVAGHSRDILALDWDKYIPFQLYTGGVDMYIKCWDVRRLTGPIQQVSEATGHTLAIRRLKSSPHEAGVVGSCSYDMSLRIWDFKQDLFHSGIIHNHHNEFVTGLDFHLFSPGLLASCSWDRSVKVFSYRS